MGPRSRAQHGRAACAHQPHAGMGVKGRPSKSPGEYVFPKKRKTKIQHVPSDVVLKPLWTGASFSHGEENNNKKRLILGKKIEVEPRGSVAFLWKHLWWGWGIQDAANVPVGHWRLSLVSGSAKPGLSQGEQDVRKLCWQEGHKTGADWMENNQGCKTVYKFSLDKAETQLHLRVWSRLNLLNKILEFMVSSFCVPSFYRCFFLFAQTSYELWDSSNSTLSRWAKMVSWCGLDCEKSVGLTTQRPFIWPMEKANGSWRDVWHYWAEEITTHCFLTWSNNTKQLASQP